MASLKYTSPVKLWREADTPGLTGTRTSVIGAIAYKDSRGAARLRGGVETAGEDRVLAGFGIDIMVR